MPLHIARVEVDNFRNFASLVIDPFPATAVIVGENNVGKTNLLHGLRLLLDPRLPDDARRLRREDVFEGSTGIAGGAVVRIAVELVGFAGDTSAEAALADCLLHDDPARARLEYIFEPRETIDEAEEQPQLSTADYDWRIVGGSGVNAKGVVREPRRYVGLRVLPAMRDAGDELTGQRSPLRELLDRLTPDHDVLVAAAADIDAAMDLLITDKAVGDLETAIRGQTTDMVGPALPVSPTLGIAPADADQLLRQIRLFTDSGRTRGLAATSVGTANILYLALLLEAVRQRRMSSEHVTTMLGVEEPEAHLHVHVQRRLFGYLLRTEPALLLTSHSPHIASVAPLDSLVLLRSTADGTVATTVSQAPLTLQQKADLERYLDVTRAELLFARLAILVEGDADLYVVPALARAAGFDLDAYGVSVLSVQGIDFAPFRALLGPDGWNIPHLIITDGDRSIDDYPASSDGLIRALALCSDPAATTLRAALPARPRADGHHELSDADNQAIRDAVEREGVFVGDVTLEVDLARNFPDALAQATEDLFGPKAYAKQKTRIDAIAAWEDTQELRDIYISRIETNAGKGRFAQRVASYLADTDVDEFASAIVEVEAGGYILRALNRASEIVRGQPLLPSTHDADGPEEGA